MAAASFTQPDFLARRGSRRALLFSSPWIMIDHREVSSGIWSSRVCANKRAEALNSANVLACPRVLSR